MTSLSRVRQKTVRGAAGSTACAGVLVADVGAYWSHVALSSGPPARVQASRTSPPANLSGRGRSHKVTVWSPLAVTRVRPFGANATPDTALVWPVRGWPSWRGRSRSLTSHSLTVWSMLPVARVRPSGANATPDTALVWPRIVVKRRWR
jgi:hypothetical protein